MRTSVTRLAAGHGIIVLRRLPSSGDDSRHLFRTGITQLFTAIASSAGGWSEMDNSNRHRLEGGHVDSQEPPDRHRLWHPLSRDNFPTRFPRSSSTFHRTRGCFETRSPRQSRLWHAPVRAHSTHDPECLWLVRLSILRCRGRCSGWDETFHAQQLWHLLHNPPRCRLVRVMAPDRLLLRAGSDEQARPMYSKKMPLSNRCSRHTPRASKDRTALEHRAYALLTLATLLEPLTRHACTERDTSRPRGRWSAVAGIANLEWRVGLVPNSPAVACTASTAVGMADFSTIAHGERCQLHTSRSRPTTGVSFHRPVPPGRPGVVPNG